MGTFVFMDLDTADRLRQMAEQRTGMLEFECSSLGLFDDLDTQLNRRFKPQIMQRAKQELDYQPGFISQMIKTVGGDYGEGIGQAHSKRLAKTYWENVKVLSAEGRFNRAVADLDDKELALLAASAAHVISMYEKEEHQTELLQFMFGVNARIVWAGGQTQYIHSEQASKFPSEAVAAEEMVRALMAHYVNANDADYRQDIGKFLGEFTQVIKHPGYQEMHPKSAVAVAQALNEGSACWATFSDIGANHSPFKKFEAGRDLFLGMLPTPDGAQAIGFAGNESLVTVAQPGAGKTQCHILPNLMTYDGPLVVLDPKLELLELTGGLRQSEGKRVIVLSLADDDTPTHRFNVMDFVDRRPEFMWNSLTELAEFLLPGSPNDNNPVFRNKAAELFAVCLGGEILDGIAAERHPTLSDAISRIFKTPESLKNWLHDIADQAAEFGCEPLEQSAMGFASLIQNENTVEDFLRYQSNATSVLTKYRGGVIERVAGGAGDWTPEDLREPGTTLYIRIPYEEMSVYGGFIRMVLYTIIKRLRRSGTEQHDLPLTFLLDEVAQLGDLDQIANVVETGRGSGLRLWMILQDYDQAKAASTKPNLILKTPKVRLFMNPTMATAKDVSEELGRINQVITGKEKPLAQAFELMGESYANSIVVLSSGAKPLHLSKHFAWQESHYEDLTQLPYNSQVD